MQNNDPKSENAAMKERAAKDKDKHGREHNTVPHQGDPHTGRGAEVHARGLQGRTVHGMQLTGNGQRWSRRIAVDIPVEVAAVGSPTIHGHLKDLSLSGALVTTDHALPLHAYIETVLSP
jgi:hypothetical protein